MDHDVRHSQEKSVTARPPRERMVRAAAQLIRRQGVSGTGMREIVDAADAPRGSLQHYFPDGKEELVGEALTWMGGVAAGRVRRHFESVSAAGGPPSRLLLGMVSDWKRDLTSEGFGAGCPLVAAAADVLAESPRLQTVIRGAFDGWEEPVRDSLVRLGVKRSRAASLAMVILSGLEGAIILARIRRDVAPLDALAAELGTVLDAAVVRR